MAFEVNNFNVAKKFALEKGEVNVECNLQMGENVKSVLSVSVDVGSINYETLNGVLNYSGNIDTKVVYLNENGEINCVCNSCPFSSKFENDNISTGMQADLSVKLGDFNIESINGDTIKLEVMLIQKGYVLSNREVKTISCSDDHVCSKFENTKVVKLVGCKQDTVELTSEINLRDKVKKVVLTDSRVLVRNVESGVNFATVSGDLIVRVLYINDNDKFESGYVYDTFKEEVELEGVTRESYVEGRAFVNHENLTTEVLEDEKGGKITVKSPLNIGICAYNEEEVSIIKDLYSTKCDIAVTTQSYDMTLVNKMEVVEGKIEGSLTLDEESPRVDKVLFFGGDSVTITNNYINDGELVLEGVAKTHVVYLNDEDNSWHSVLLDVPFSISDKTNFGEGSYLNVDTIVCDVDVSVKKGRELLYDAKVKASVNSSVESTSAVISEAVENDEYEEKDYAMEVVFASKGEELWDISKKARVKEEQILNQNPDVIFPVAEDTSLILFYQKLN